MVGAGVKPLLLCFILLPVSAASPYYLATPFPHLQISIPYPEITKSRSEFNPRIYAQCA
jgi:hypothetical protein